MLFLRCCLVCVLLLCLAAPAGAVENVTDQNFPRMLRALLKEHPELVMDVLRENSESVLDIAQQGSALRRQRLLKVQWAEEVEQPRDVGNTDRVFRGPENAPVTIVAYSDFSCPYCQQGAETIQRLMREQPQNIRLVFKHMPLGKNSVGRQAAEYFVAATFQNPELAWKLYDTLFSQRQTLITEGESFIKSAAADLGLNVSQLASDSKSRKVRRIIDADLADAERLGIEGTPFFFVNNLTVRGALPYEFFQTAVDMALQQARKTRK